jgi:hypothetical protein
MGNKFKFLFACFLFFSLFYIMSSQLDKARVLAYSPGDLLCSENELEVYIRSDMSVFGEEFFDLWRCNYTRESDICQTADKETGSVDVTRDNLVNLRDFEVWRAANENCTNKGAIK